MKEFIDYLRFDRTPEKAVELYQIYGNDLSFKNSLNFRVMDDHFFRVLLEELRKSFGLEEADFNFYMSKKVEIRLNTQVKNIDHKSEETIPVKLIEIPEEIKRSLKLRDEFPFLNKPDCPNELKILVADMLTAYDSYREKHKALFDAATEEEFTEIALGVVGDYITNKNAWKVLEHYKNTGEILKISKTITWADRETEIRSLPNNELIKLSKNIPTSVTKLGTKIKKNPESKKIQEWTEKREWLLKELSLVKQLLNI